jgi:CPA2 family monovalent cation:H+ antiporter-2
MFRIARSLGRLLAQAAFPPRSQQELDLAAVPRRALRVSLELGIMLLATLPLLAVTQPFVSGFPTALLVLVLVGSLGVALWRTTTDLEGHVRAGAQAVIEALAAQARPAPGRAQSPGLDRLDALLPGLGELVSIRIEPDSPVVDHTLAEVDLRGQTGATVLAIHRGEQRIGVPSARDVLRAGDVLALAGSVHAVAAAASLLRGGADPG